LLDILWIILDGSSCLYRCWYQFCSLHSTVSYIIIIIIIIIIINLRSYIGWLEHINVSYNILPVH